MRYQPFCACPGTVFLRRGLPVSKTHFCSAQISVHVEESTMSIRAAVFRVFLSLSVANRAESFDPVRNALVDFAV